MLILDALIDPRTVTSGMAGLTASPSGNIKTEGAEFHLAVDYGTVNLVSAYRVLMPGYEVSAEDRIFDLFAGEVNTSVPQTIAFGTDNNGNPRGDFYWGAEAEQALARARASYDTVVTQWKVLLYDRHTNRGVASRVRSQFEQLGIDLETLIAQHLRKIIQAAKEHVRSSGVMGKAAKIIDTMPVKLFLGVPNIWESPANCAMVEAANAAGASHVELVLESECAAASYAHLIKHSPPRDHSPGDRVLIFDLGGGTGDLQVLEFVSEATDGAKVKLRTAGVAQGTSP